MKKITFVSTIGLVLMMLIPCIGNAQGTTDRHDYLFKQKATPSGLAVTDNVIYAYANNKTYTLRGDELSTFGDDVLDVQQSPAGLSYAVISRKKNKTEVAVFDPLEVDKEIFKLNNKKYGEPTAISYTPDARRLLIATTTGLKIFDARNFTLLGEMPLPYEPTEIAVSNNNNFLAISNGEKVTVYNFETQKERKSWNFEEGVSAIGFSKDNTQFAVLSKDGYMNVYDTINFLVKKSVEDLGDGIDGGFNFDGKYVAVASSPENIMIINLLNDEERDSINVPTGLVSDIELILDSGKKTLLAFNTLNAVGAKRLTNLEPYFGKLIASEVNELMNEWLKMMPGESMEEYRARISDENRAKQMRLFEDEVSTRYADNLLSMSTISLGKYDRSNNLLELDFDNMPNIYLPVPETEVGAFADVNKLKFSDTKYGIMDNDNFELIYAKIHNNENGLDYIYDNLDRKPLSFMGSDDDLVSVEIIQQQQMEELRLQELRQRVMDEAKKENVISDHTNITVDSRIVPDYNADGKRILNYQVNFSYEVEPGFSAQEDFAPGKYEVSQSGAASSMLSIIKQAFEGDLAQYLTPGKKLMVKIYGNADSSPIARAIPYSGVYGDFDNELVYQNGQLKGISINKKSGITQNEQLAFLRAYGVTDYLNNNVDAIKDMNTDTNYYIDVLEGKGGEYRRITAEFTIVDVF